jgi:hypothetical protein
MAKADKFGLTVHFARERDTKGTIVFKEVNADGTEAFSPTVKSMYVAKHAFKDGKVPDNLTATITEK